MCAGGQAGVCLVLGSEGQGLSQDAQARCAPVSLPMPGDMESLNVSHAGAILMFLLSGAPLDAWLRSREQPPQPAQQ